MTKEEIERIVAKGFDLYYFDGTDSNGKKYIDMTNEEKLQYRLNCPTEKRIIGRVNVPTVKTTFGVDYSTDPKGKQIEVITYPCAEDYVMSEEQAKDFARFIYNNIGDVHKYIEENQEEFVEFLKEEYKNREISKKELDFELERLSK